MSSDPRPQVAEQNLKQALDIEASVRVAQSIPADIIEMVRTKCHLTHEQIDDVVDAVKSGISTPAEYLGVTPAIANTVEAMALEFYRQKHFQYAVGLYAFLIEIDRDRATAWRGLAACNQAVRQYPLAVLCYQQALGLDPVDVVSMVFLGECLLIEGWREEGIRTLQMAELVGAAVPAQAIYVKRARMILSAQNGDGAIPTRPIRQTLFKAAEPAKAASPAAESIMNPLGEVDIEAILAMDQVDFAKHPKIHELAKRLQARLQRREITYKDVAGFTDEQMYGGYAAACRLIDAGKPLSALEVIGWMLYFDCRNGQYYQVAGLAAQHAKLYCYADYLYALSLIYDRNNPVTMLYQGEVKIYSFERHKGVELLRQAVDLLSKDPAQNLLVKRGKALIKQFEKKPVSQQKGNGVSSK